MRGALAARRLVAASARHRACAAPLNSARAAQRAPLTIAAFRRVLFGEGPPKGFGNFYPKGGTKGGAKASSEKAGARPRAFSKPPTSLGAPDAATWIFGGAEPRATPRLRA